MDRCAYILESFNRLNVQVDLKSFGCPKHPANCLSNMRERINTHKTCEDDISQTCYLDKLQALENCRYKFS